MPRNLPEDFFNSPSFMTFINNVARDPELHPEIRDGSLTVYYRGDALIRDLQVRGGQIVGDVHFKYIPIRSQEEYVRFRLCDTGLSVPQDVAPLAIGTGELDVLAEYKRVMKSVSSGLEAPIIHEIVCNLDNVILDQEIKFQTPGNSTNDKIDIVHFDTHLNCLAFVEVKGIHDERLLPRDGDLPEVIDQLKRYRQRINDRREAILEDYQRVLVLKRRLGLTSRLTAIPEESLNCVLRKPVLVIGNCSRDEVKAIKNSEEKWAPLMDGLKENAAGLILCASAGCSLRLQKGRQVVVFDPTKS